MIAWLYCKYKKVKLLFNTHKCFVYAVSDGVHLQLMVFNKNNKRLEQVINVIDDNFIELFSEKIKNDYSNGRLINKKSVSENYIRYVYSYAIHAVLPSQTEQLTKLFGLYKRTCGNYCDSMLNPFFCIVKDLVMYSAYEITNPLLRKCVYKNIKKAVQK